MGFEFKIENDILLVRLSGRFEAYEVPVLESWLTEQLTVESNKFVIIDMSQTTFVDTHALSYFVTWMKNLRQKGGELALVESPCLTNVVINLMRLDEVFEIFKSVEKAKESLGRRIVSKVEIVTSSFTIETHSGVSILHFTGRIDAFEVGKIQKHIEAFPLEKWGVIDLSKTYFLDSAGLALLVRILKKSRSMGGQVVLVVSQYETTIRIFDLTRMDNVFHKVTTVEEGLSLLKINTSFS